MPFLLLVYNNSIKYLFFDSLGFYISRISVFVQLWISLMFRRELHCILKCLLYAYFEGILKL